MALRDRDGNGRNHDHRSNAMRAINQDTPFDLADDRRSGNSWSVLPRPGPLLDDVVTHRGYRHLLNKLTSVKPTTRGAAVLVGREVQAP